MRDTHAAAVPVEQPDTVLPYDPDDWDRRLAEARQRREAVLRQRGAPQDFAASSVGPSTAPSADPSAAPSPASAPGRSGAAPWPQAGPRDRVQPPGAGPARAPDPAHWQRKLAVARGLTDEAAAEPRPRHADVDAPPKPAAAQGPSGDPQAHARPRPGNRTPATQPGQDTADHPAGGPNRTMVGRTADPIRHAIPMHPSIAMPDGRVMSVGPHPWVTVQERLAPDPTPDPASGLVSASAPDLAPDLAPVAAPATRAAVPMAAGLAGLLGLAAGVALTALVLGTPSRDPVAGGQVPGPVETQAIRQPAGQGAAAPGPGFTLPQAAPSGAAETAPLLEAAPRGAAETAPVQGGALVARVPPPAGETDGAPVTRSDPVAPARSAHPGLPAMPAMPAIPTAAMDPMAPPPLAPAATARVAPPAPAPAATPPDPPAAAAVPRPGTAPRSGDGRTDGDAASGTGRGTDAGASTGAATGPDIDAQDAKDAQGAQGAPGAPGAQGAQGGTAPFVVVHVPPVPDAGLSGPVLAAARAADWTTVPIDFTISRSHLRVYHDRDRATAAALGDRLGLPVRDFTASAPAPLGLIEVWIAGGPASDG